MVETNNKQIIDINLGKHKIKNFAVYPTVVDPRMVTSINLAKWLLSQKNMFKGKSVIDMGCGTGIQGITAGLGGAAQVILVDINEYAIANAKENIKTNKLAEKAEVVESDLFENVKKKADIIIFNHHFFTQDFPEGEMTGNMMLSRVKLFNNFLRQAKDSLNTDGVIIMPYFYKGDPANDPKKAAQEHNYAVEEKYKEDIDEDSKKGTLLVYFMKYKRV